ncbi:MAG: shikimate kinase [Desulfovibrio sp.]|nr:shikimate kinase [Desulfovibrio sp.]
MPGAGKSTIGSRLAGLTGYAFIDTDLVIEAVYGRRLQDICDQLSREDFLNVESQIICALAAAKSVIATGGSVIYRPGTMEHLKRLGSVVHLSLTLPEIEERVARNPERGISFGPGQTLEDLYNERMALYRRHASYECDSGLLNPEECAKWIIRKLGLPFQPGAA